MFLEQDTLSQAFMTFVNMPETLFFSAFLPVCTAQYKRVFEVSGKGCADTSVDAFCEHA